jgi:hypothetical protein
LSVQKAPASLTCPTQIPRKNARSQPNTKRSHTNETYFNKFLEG